MRGLRDDPGRPLATAPDVQFHLATLSADMAGGTRAYVLRLHASVCQLRPNRAATCASERPTRSSARDAAELPLGARRPRPDIRGVRPARKLAATSALHPTCRRVPPRPDATTDEAILEFVRDKGATIFHPVGPAAWVLPQSRWRSSTPT